MPLGQYEMGQRQQQYLSSSPRQTISHRHYNQTATQSRQHARYHWNRPSYVQATLRQLADKRGGAPLATGQYSASRWVNTCSEDLSSDDRRNLEELRRTFLRQGPQLQHSEQPSPQPPRQGGHTQQPDPCACRTSSPCRLRRHIPLRRTSQPGFSKKSLVNATAKARRRNSRRSACVAQPPHLHGCVKWQALCDIQCSDHSKAYNMHRYWFSEATNRSYPCPQGFFSPSTVPPAARIYASITLACGTYRLRGPTLHLRPTRRRRAGGGRRRSRGGCRSRAPPPSSGGTNGTCCPARCRTRALPARTVSESCSGVEASERTLRCDQQFRSCRPA